MRKSQLGVTPKQKTIHGYADRTFGSVISALGSSLPLTRDERIRIKWGMNLIQMIEAENIAKHTA